MNHRDAFNGCSAAHVEPIAHKGRSGIFGGLALLPLIDYGLRRAAPPGPMDSVQDLSTAVAIVSVLPLLMARLAVERGELKQVDGKLKLMAAAVEEANELIQIVSADLAGSSLIRHRSTQPKRRS